MSGSVKADGPTEEVLDAAENLDQRSPIEILELIHAEDGKAHEAVGRVLSDIESAVDVLVCALSGGGCWFNVGAGTSGRLGVLDASEIPPTFGMPPRTVQGVVAGGDRALQNAVEGAEDNAEAGAWALRERSLAMGDVVVALSASGRTPFTLGAIEAAHEVGARTIAITCDPGSPLADAAEVSIAPVVGPEVLSGSTRMKGGLAQKMVLHMLSTAVMVKLGRVHGNLMVHLSPVNEKLRGRAENIVMRLLSVDAAEARRRLAENDGSVEQVVRTAKRSA